MYALPTVPRWPDVSGNSAATGSRAGTTGAPDPAWFQRWLEVARPLSVQTWGDLLASQQAILDKLFMGPLLAGRELEAGGWRADTVHTHRTAQLIAPTYCGQDCSVV